MSRVERGFARAALLYAALTLALAWPLSVHPGSAVLSDTPDTNLELWALAWDAHAFVHQPLSPFDANIYYPERHTLAYSENFIGSAIVAAPVIWLTGNLVLALNLVSLLSCVLCGAGAFVLARKIGASETAAVIAGLVFAFSPPRFLRLDQLHLTTVQWMPFALAFLHAYLHDRRRADLHQFAAFFTLQALTSGHGAVFLIVACVIVVAYHAVFFREPLALRARAADFGVVGALWLAPAVLLVLPYRQVQAEMGLRRSLENWAVPIESFIASPAHAHMWVLEHLHAASVNDTAGAYLFPGTLTLLLALYAIMPRARSRTSAAAGALDATALLAVVAALYRAGHGPFRIRIDDVTLLSVRRAWLPWAIAAVAVIVRIVVAGPRVGDSAARVLRSWRDRSNAAPLYAIIALVSVWLSIGPPLSIWPLVYWLPGFNFIRVPSRFIILTVLALAILVAIGFDRLTMRAGAARRWLGTIAGALLVAEWAAMPFAIEPRRVEIPAIDRWLATQPRDWVIAEVPLADPRDLGRAERRHTAYMLHSTAHWLRTIEGYSGFRSPLHEQLYARVANFPDAASLHDLAALGVTHVVVHAEDYDPAEWIAVRRRIEISAPRLRLEHEEPGGGRVYALSNP